MRRAILSFGLVLTLLSAACTNPEPPDPTETSPKTSFELTASTFLGIGDREIPTVFSWQVDQEAGYVYTAMPTIESSELISPSANIDPGLITEQVAQDGGVWTRGLIRELNATLYSDETEPDAWYEVAYFPTTPFDVTEALPSAAALRAQLGLEFEEAEREDWPDLKTFRTKTTDPQRKALRELSESGDASPVTKWVAGVAGLPDSVIFTGEDAEGRLVAARIELGEERNKLTEVIEFSDFGVTVNQVQVSDPQPIRSILNLP